MVLFVDSGCKDGVNIKMGLVLSVWRIGKKHRLATEACAVDCCYAFRAIELAPVKDSSGFRFKCMALVLVLLLCEIFCNMDGGRRPVHLLFVKPVPLGTLRGFGGHLGLRRQPLGHQTLRGILMDFVGCVIQREMVFLFVLHPLICGSHETLRWLAGP